MSDVMMHPLKIALIGHSGAGKSVCLDELRIDRRSADMDASFGRNHCPSLAAAVRWLMNETSDQPIVVVSNHEEMLKVMWQAKLRGEEGELFRCVLFVCLRKPKDRLACHLAKPNAAGRCRDLASQQYTLTSYDRLDAMFQELAGNTIDCTTKGVAEVAAEVASLLKSLDKGSAEPGAAPNGGPGTPSGNSGVEEGPPSVC